MTLALPTAAELARIYAADLDPADVGLPDGTCTREIHGAPCGADLEAHDIVQGDRVVGQVCDTDADGNPICADCADDDRHDNARELDPNDPEARGLDPDALYDRAREDTL